MLLGLWFAVPNVVARESSAPPVKCTETAHTFILDNGILRAEIEKHNGRMSSLVYQGRELLAQNGGYWSSVGRNNGGPSGHVASILMNTSERAEVSCQFGNVAGHTNAAMDSDYIYSLGRGQSVIYVAAVLHHDPGTPRYGTGESRYCLKLNPDVFNFLSVDARRQRLMPSGYDWDHGKQLNLKEARLLTTGIHKGEVEHKYDYSAVLAETPAYGWYGTQSHLGLWLINPSQEYIGGGPTKVELTGHLDVNPGGLPVLLNMWQGSHYGGTSLSIGSDENWTKVIGPFAIYCNQRATSTNAWHDALAHAKTEKKLWPYAWFQNPNYPSAAERGTVNGKITLRDAFDPNAKMSNVWVGVAAPNYLPPLPHFRGGSRFHRPGWGSFNITNWMARRGLPPTIGWQRDTKFYQFWTRAKADGSFTIRNVRPGHYTLHAFGDGVLGEFALTNVVVAPGKTNAVGQLFWQPKRFGHTVWQIGIPDRTAREFRHGNDYWHWGLYYLYPKEFPHDVDFIIGKSNWRTDWNYVQPPRITDSKFAADQPILSEEDEAGDNNANSNPGHHSPDLQNTTWKIEFTLTNQPSGKATLRLAFAGSRGGCHVGVSINGHSIGDTGPLPNTGVMHRDGIRGYWFERDLTFDAKLLQPGNNIFRLTSYADNWTQGVLYDCVRLELNGKM